MKKVIILFSLAASAICAEAQIFIPKAGITVSNLDIEEDYGLKPRSKTGFTVGAAFNVKLAGVFSLQAEMDFIQKGYRIDETTELEDYGSSVKSKVTMNYLECPVLGIVTFGKSTKFFFSAGPSVAVGIGGKHKSEVSISYMGVSETSTIEGDVKFGSNPPDGYNPAENGDLYISEKVDIGFQMGTGMIIAEKIMIDIRYGLGLTSLDGEDLDTSPYNNAFQFTIGVPILLKK